MTAVGYTDIDLASWYRSDHEMTREIVIPADMDPILTLSVYDIPFMIADTDKFLVDKQKRPSSVSALTRSLLWSVFSAVCSEQDVILDDEKIMVKYADLMFDRLDEGRDTGLVWDGSLVAWTAMTDKEKTEIRSTVRSSAKIINEEFPEMVGLNIIDTALAVRLDWGADILSGIIPVTVETPSGLCGVVPGPIGDHMGYPDSDVLSLSHTVASVHVWDAETMTVNRADPDRSRYSAEVMFDIATAWHTR